MNQTSFPYWQFQNGKWLSGKISSFDLDGQGLFLQFCMAAWEGNGKFCVCPTSLRLRFKKSAEWISETVQAMVEVGIIVKHGDRYGIKFIDDQLAALNDIREKRSVAGKVSADTRHRREKSREEKSREEKGVEKCSTHVQHMFNTCSTHVEKRFLMLEARKSLAALENQDSAEAKDLLAEIKRLEAEITEETTKGTK